MACGQAPAVADSNVVLELEIMTPRQGANQLNSQRWGKFFQEQGEVVRVRETITGDEIGTTETSRGTFRLVRVVGELDREGRLRVPGHVFELTEPGKIKAWLIELHTYGAQGVPEGKPNWGLNQEQFTGVYDSLVAPLITPQQTRPLGDVMADLALPKQYPLVIHPSARSLYEAAKQVPLLDEVQGLSTGTALAGILVQNGLGFRPIRTPTGGIELVVQPLSEISDPWPVGWPVDAKPRNLIVPKMFQWFPGGFNAVPLNDVLHAIAKKQETPIIVNRSACLAKEIDLNAPVTYPQKDKTTWALVLESVVHQSKLSYELRRDEAGTIVVYITPFEPKVIKR